MRRKTSASRNEKSCWTSYSVGHVWTAGPERQDPTCKSHYISHFVYTLILEGWGYAMWPLWDGFRVYDNTNQER